MKDNVGATPSRSNPALSQAVKQRDAGLSLVTRANRWMISAAVVVAGGLTALTAHAFHARAATTTRTATPVSSPAPSQSPVTGDDQAPLQGPSTVPAPSVPVPQPVAPVVSGGS